LKWKNLKSVCLSRDEYDFFLANFYFLYSKEDYEKYDKPEKIFKKIIKKNKDEWLVQQSEKNLMAMDFKKDQFKSLQEKACRAVKAYPQWYCGYAFLGICEIHLGKNYSKAKEYFEKSIILEETAQGRCWQAYAEYLLKDYKKCLALYERAMELDMVVLFFAEPTMAAAHSAMILGKWNAARWILDAQKSANKDIENCSEDYKELRRMLEQHDV